MNQYNEINLIWLLQILIIIAFFLLMLLAAHTFCKLYIADCNKCKSYIDAENAGKIGSKEYTIALLDSILADSTWPIAFISAAISVFFIILGLGLPATIKNILIIFLFTFISYYAILLFVSYHYIQVIKKSIKEYIIKSKPYK